MHMKKYTKEVLITLLLSIVVPSVIFRIAERCIQKEGNAAQEVVQTTESTVPQNTETYVSIIMDGYLHKFELEEYITGVVLAEMPASFEMEALKAQAVVARTYALKRSVTSGKHPNNAVCTDPGCCQAYIAPAGYILENDATLLDKVAKAVLDTSGQVLTYEGTLIDATYFSCSGGRTEDALAVWGQEIPYLTSVESPGEERAAHYVDTVSFTIREFSALLGLEFSDVHGDWIGKITYTAGGGVHKIQLCDREYTGGELRQKLGLRSTAFTITAIGDTVTITTKGFGHRVGMSQYGAEAMAAVGENYEEILTHYYPGTKLEQWDGD